MDKPMTFNEWLGTQGNLALVHANCCRIAFEGGQQSQQAKVEELQKRVDAALLIANKNIEQCRVTEKRRDFPLWMQNQAFVIRELMQELEQALKGEVKATPNLNIDEKGECRHFSTTMFFNGKAECFHCDALVDEGREVIGKQKKADWTVSKVKTYEETWDLNYKKEGDQ